jgi:hypothetical protein
MAAHPEMFTGPGRPVPYGDIVIVGVLQWLKFGVLAAATLLIASFPTPTSTRSSWASSCS